MKLNWNFCGLIGIGFAQAWEKVGTAVKGMGKTIKHSAVWQPSLFMFLSLALSVSTHEGQFYWYTDKTAGPHFSQVHISFFFLSNGYLVPLISIQFKSKGQVYRPISQVQV